MIAPAARLTNRTDETCERSAPGRGRTHEGGVMRTRIINGLLVLTAVGGFAGLPATVAAKNGADDPAGHNANDQRRGRGSDDVVARAARHTARHAARHAARRAHGADDAPGDDHAAR